MTNQGRSAHPCERALDQWCMGVVGSPVGAESAPMAVAYSGGADSTALLHTAHARWPGRVVALHVHHGLQAAADGFEAHARTQCQELGLPLVVRHIQAAHQPGESPEAVARDKRYATLADMACEAGAAWVLLGQHASDQAETVLLALSRGAGLPGLAAMPSRFERHGVRFGRPFLGLSAQVLRDWLEEQAIAFVDDPSNTDQRFTRNRIRAVVLPALESCFPGYQTALARSARHAAQAQELLDDLAMMDLQQTGGPPAIAPLRLLARARQANVLRHWLRREAGMGASAAQLDELLDQVAACTTRGHRIHIKVGPGFVIRVGDRIAYEPPI